MLLVSYYYFLCSDFLADFLAFLIKLGILTRIFAICDHHNLGIITVRNHTFLSVLCESYILSIKSIIQTLEKHVTCVQRYFKFTTLHTYTLCLHLLLWKSVLKNSWQMIWCLYSHIIKNIEIKPFSIGWIWNKETDILHLYVWDNQRNFEFHFRVYYKKSFVDDFHHLK